MKEEIKKILADHRLAYSRANYVFQIEKAKDDTIKEIESLISSHYISKDKVMEIAEFSMGYGFALGKGFNFERMHEIGKNETLEGVVSLEHAKTHGKIVELEIYIESRKRQIEICHGDRKVDEAMQEFLRTKISELESEILTLMNS